jgi:hypothetical protein
MQCSWWTPKILLALLPDKYSSLTLLNGYWLDDDFIDDVWIAPQATDIIWDDNLSEIDDWSDEDLTDEDWITNCIDA